MISQTQHEREELGWRQVAKWLAEEAARTGRLKQLKWGALYEICK